MRTAVFATDILHLLHGLTIPHFCHGHPPLLFFSRKERDVLLIAITLQWSQHERSTWQQLESSADGRVGQPVQRTALPLPSSCLPCCRNWIETCEASVPRSPGSTSPVGSPRPDPALLQHRRYSFQRRVRLPLNGGAKQMCAALLACGNSLAKWINHL